MNQDKEQRGSFRHPNMSVRPMLNIRSGAVTVAMRWSYN